MYKRIHGSKNPFFLLSVSEIVHSLFEISQLPNMGLFRDYAFVTTIASILAVWLAGKVFKVLMERKRVISKLVGLDFRIFCEHEDFSLHHVH